MIKLSILIATISERFYQFCALDKELRRQANDPLEQTVQVFSHRDMFKNIGTKRNELLMAAQGDYIVFIDDDDTISSNYIAKILAATESNPDCIGISGMITTNGADERQWHISKDFGSWYEKDNIYYRTPNHISPVRRELALQAGFPEIAHGEDYEYSMRLLPLLKTEVKIEENIYHYDYRTK
jgi:glycosyltransferase involved in cell wall biosynthesis